MADEKQEAVREIEEWFASHGYRLSLRQRGDHWFASYARLGTTMTFSVLVAGESAFAAAEGARQKFLERRERETRR
jgi:hypothetical protein